MKSMLRYILTAFTFVSLLHLEAADLYFLRHAQTMANVTREYTEENQRTFSPIGKEQVAGVVDKLAEHEFDIVLVSPAYRTLHTVLPVLSDRGMTAEIWPELYECCWDRETEEEEPQVTRGDRIELEENIAAYFTFRDDDAVYMLSVETPARGELMVADAVDRLQERFAGTGKRVLIVSHYHTSGRIMRSLLGDAAPWRIQPRNAELSHLEEDEDGQWVLRMLNDEPQ